MHYTVRYFPDWFPGMSWRQDANTAYGLTQGMLKSPIELVKQRIVCNMLCGAVFLCTTLSSVMAKLSRPLLAMLWKVRLMALASTKKMTKKLLRERSRRLMLVNDIV